MLVFYIFFFVLGTVIGSFLNVVINRLITKESILRNRSHCPFCKKKLNWLELIPIISFILQGGRCRKCKKKIPCQYPLVEFFTGLIFLLIIFNFSAIGGPALGWQFIISTIFLLIISCFLIVLFVYDLKHYLVPDVIIYPALIITLIYQIYFSIISNQLSFIVNYLLAGLIGGLFFLILVLISRGRWMGLGDVKIGILMGLLLGLSQVFTALFLAFLSGATVAIVLLILKKKELKSEIPFGPFLTGATFVTIIWGEILLNWYLNLFI